jgi:uncharacterized membrane protein
MFRRRTEQSLSITGRRSAVEAFVSLAVFVSVGALFLLIAGLKEHQHLGRDVLLLGVLIAAPVTIFGASRYYRPGPDGLSHRRPPAH